MTMVSSRVLAAIGLSASLFAAARAHGDSVAQVATAKRISRQTVTLIDPQGRFIPGGTANTLIQVGDVLTFVVQFTPVPNGAYRGMGGYITDYIPANTEVVGARIVDRDGNTVAPHRGGLACDGYGPRGKNNYSSPDATLVEGSVSQLYADTGIFYSQDPRTRRRSKNPTTSQDEPFLSVKNGLPMLQSPSGAGQYDQLLNAASPYYAHNAWDLAQVAKWGPGTGNTPEHVGSSGIGYGSPVAGPDSWYQLEVTAPVDTLPNSNASNVLYLGHVGPWKRIRQMGSEKGQRGQGDTPPSAAQNTTYQQCPGSAPTRIGAPTSTGFELTSATPLPSDTNAVRFALGELVVGDEYYAEISLRVKALPLDPNFGNINCAEVAGGDASSRAQNGSAGGKDHLWRYFLPAPACVSLDLLFENSVDKVLASSGSTLTYTIEAKNLTTSPMNNVVVRDCYVAGNQTLVPAGTTTGYVLDSTGAGCPSPGTQRALVWSVGSLEPGQGKTFTVQFTGSNSTTNQAVFVSDTFPAPGFVANAYTTVADVAIMRLALAATPAYVAALPAVVHYTATVNNIGTGSATTIVYSATLPSSTWTYVPGSTRVNGSAVAGNPTQSGAKLSFLPGASLLPSGIAAGATHTVEFDVQIPGAFAAGLYTSDLSTWVKSVQDFEDSTFRTAPVAVLTARSTPPTAPLTLTEGMTVVSGTSSEASSSAVKVYVNDNVLGTGSVGTDGTYSVTVPALFAGQHVQVTVTAPGKLESQVAPVPALVVTGKALPADLTPQPECSDGLDNDADGKADYPEDPQCCSYLDDSETDGTACVMPARCADGVDNDSDGFVDFPFDLGCASALDDDELDVLSVIGQGPDGGAGDAGVTSATGQSDASGGAGSSGTGRPAGALPPDLGGVDESEETSAAAEAGGCGCRVAGATQSGNPWHALTFAAGLIWRLARRRRNRAR